MAIDWSKPIRTRLHQHIVVLIRRECRADDQPRRIVRIPGYCLGTFMYREDGAPAMNAPTIENYDPEVENKPVTVDWTKPIQTTDGKPARLICSDLKHDHPYVVATEYNGKEIFWTVTETGRVRGSTPGDGKSGIINVPEKRTKYLNIYKKGDIEWWSDPLDDRKFADSCAGTNRIACVKVEYTVGQFDI